MTQEELKKLIENQKTAAKMNLKWTTEDHPALSKAFWNGMFAARTQFIDELEYFLEDELEERM